MLVFAVLALLLASLRIYGVMTFLVKQSVQEVGIRMALGAQARDVLILALILMAIGTAIGLVGSIFVTHIMSTAFWSVRNGPVHLCHRAVNP